MEFSQERRVLGELERQLRRQDPAFVDRMRAGSFPSVPARAVAFYLLIPIAMLFVGWSGVVAVLGVAAVIAVFRAGRRLRRLTGPEGVSPGG